MVSDSNAKLIETKKKKIPACSHETPVVKILSVVYSRTLKTFMKFLKIEIFSFKYIIESDKI